MRKPLPSSRGCSSSPSRMPPTLPRCRKGCGRCADAASRIRAAQVTNFSYRLCRNHAFDAAMDAQVKNAKECSTSFDDLGSGQFAAASSCTLGGRVIVSKGTYTYDSATLTHAESHATYTPAFNGKTEETLLQEQRYFGRMPGGNQSRRPDHERRTGAALRKIALSPPARTPARPPRSARASRSAHTAWPASSLTRSWRISISTWGRPRPSPCSRDGVVGLVADEVGLVVRDREAGLPAQHLEHESRETTVAVVEHRGRACRASRPCRRRSWCAAP